MYDTIAPGDIVFLHHKELEHKGLVVAITDHGIHVEVDGPRSRVIVMPPSLVEPAPARHYHHDDDGDAFPCMSDHAGEAEAFQRYLDLDN